MTDLNAINELLRPVQEQGITTAAPGVADTTRLDILRAAAEAAGEAYATQCVRAAFQVVHATHPQARTLLVDKDEDDDGDTRIMLLAVLGTNDDVLWFHSVYEDHPRAYATVGRLTEDEIDGDTLAEIEEVLRIAYDQPGRTPTGICDNDDYLGLYPHRSWNLLRFEMPGPAPVPVAAERHMEITGISEAQFYGISERLGMPRGQLGRFKGGPGELRDIFLDDTGHSCGDRFDQAIAYIQELGLAYALTVETHYKYRPTN